MMATDEASKRQASSVEAAKLLLGWSLVSNQGWQFVCV
jgi:hypothetical protein